MDFFNWIKVILNSDVVVVYWLVVPTHSVTRAVLSVVEGRCLETSVQFGDLFRC